MLSEELVHIALGGLASDGTGMDSVHFAEISDDRGRRSQHLAEKRSEALKRRDDQMKLFE